jgi:hypothetical protein
VRYPGFVHVTDLQSRVAIQLSGTCTLGRMYEDRKEYAKAFEMYSPFTHQWRNADPDLQPLVRDGHARMAALEKSRAL